MGLIDFLYDSSKPPEVKNAKIQNMLRGGTCAMTGEIISDGYRIKDIIKPDTANIADDFRYINSSDFVSKKAGDIFRAQTLIRGNVLCLKNEMLRPLISKESAEKEGRPCWRDLIFELDFGTECVAIFTDESKKRLWVNSVVSIFGKNWTPLFNGSVVKLGKSYKSSEISRLMYIDCDKLRSNLGIIEWVQSKGCTKKSILTGILGDDIEGGIRKSIKMENVLKSVRGDDNFLLALFIAQGSKK